MTDQSPREQRGQTVRETWVTWAKRQRAPKRSWLVGWDDLDDGQREVDMLIGDAVAAGERARIWAHPVTQRFEIDDCILHCAGCGEELTENGMTHQPRCSEIWLATLLGEEPGLG